MNLVLFKPDEVSKPLPLTDRRAKHILDVLGKKAGDAFKAGVINTSLGDARIEAIDNAGILFRYTGVSTPPALAPLTLLLGFPRPIQARRIFKDLASLGVERIILTGTELGEKSYRESNFFRNGEYAEHLIEGAEQAGNPRLPEVVRHWSLAKAISSLAPGAVPELRLLLHPHGAAGNLGSLGSPVFRGQEANEARIILAIGSERGWTDGELALLGASGFSSMSLGPRILKTETACLAAVAILLSKMGLM